jgi:hypothetical protein
MVHMRAFVTLGMIGTAAIGYAEDAVSLSVPNPSFEEAAPSSAGAPRAWQFVGPGTAQEGAWTREAPFRGERALRVDARHGTQEWKSLPIDIRPQQDYVLRWHARFHGEKPWRFRAEFCGLEVEFRDRAGRSLNQVRQHSSCWQTVGWRPAWFLFATPQDAVALVVRFGVRTGTALPGGFDVDAIELDTMPPSEPFHAGRSLLTVKVDDDRGTPTYARVRIADADGNTFAPRDAITYEQNGGAFHFAQRGICHVYLPPGRYTITATKGFEYHPWISSVAVEDAQALLLVRLERAWDWRRRGWYCGDHQPHLYRHGGSLFPSVTWRDVLNVARSEGLDFLPFMGADQYPTAAQGAMDELNTEDLVAELTHEITDDFWGHVCPIGVSSEARLDPRYASGPMNFDRHAAIADRGGFLCYAHPYGPLDAGRSVAPIADVDAGLVSREFPVDLALGMPCGIDLLTMEGNRNQLDRKLEDLYRLFNLGFRPAITASTDFHVEQGRQVIGAVRTYVRSGALDLASIASAYHAGRTFATNGPLVDLRVADSGPGDEISLATGDASVAVRLEAVSIGPLARAEIVVNGKVYRTITPSEPHRISGQVDVAAKTSLWIAARVIGQEFEHLASSLEGRPLGASQFAHTTPVYVIVDGRPIYAAEPADAEYFAQWCEALMAAWRARLTTSPDDAKDDAIVSQRLQRAKSVFEALAKHRPQ